MHLGERGDRVGTGRNGGKGNCSQDVREKNTSLKEKRMNERKEMTGACCYADKYYWLKEKQSWKCQHMALNFKLKLRKLVPQSLERESKRGTESQRHLEDEHI